MEHLVTRKACPMKFAHLTSRSAVGGVAAALATAGLVGVTSTSASAPPVCTTYSCVTPLGPSRPPVTVGHRAAAEHRAGRIPGPGGSLQLQLDPHRRRRHGRYSRMLRRHRRQVRRLRRLLRRHGREGARCLDQPADRHATPTRPSAARAPTRVPAAGGRQLRGEHAQVVHAGRHQLQRRPVAMAPAPPPTPTKIGTIVTEQAGVEGEGQRPASAKKGAVVGQGQGHQRVPEDRRPGPDRQGHRQGRQEEGRPRASSRRTASTDQGEGHEGRRAQAGRLLQGDGYTDKGKSKKPKVVIKA